ncbi:MAG: ABC transporter substrate-binding protein [Acidaminococcus sp.]|jgi:iron(III) transport system substrate-binding protein|nr:ABC transporter substrate-binding protein [Acidaminococcus sp.]MCI2114417.1 ABC transporter substrate-binding protein [Acidaminococcus sp.]MCI2116194.1 ABC transporter substrate-binding protein [Acidaminococcus sp.]
MWLKKGLAVGMTALLCLGLAGCGSKNEPAKKNADKKLSGKVVVYMPSPSGLNKKYVQAFEKKTGVKVELFEGTTGKILARLEAEKDNPAADVVVLASWSDGLSLKNKGVLQSYKPKNVDKMYDGWVDKDSMLFGTSASAVGVIYNTKLIPKLDADWDELADPKYKDQIAIPDPQKSGACKDFLAGYMNAKGPDGWKTWENLRKNGLMIPGANKAALEAVTTGEKGILIAGVDYNGFSSIKKGEPLAMYYPKSGTIINPRPAMILKSSKNLDNARAFVDFLLSDEGQKLVGDAYLLPGRKDIKTDKRPNVSDIPQLKHNWDEMMKNAADYAAKLVALCK